MAILRVSNQEAASLKGTSPETAKHYLRQARRRLASRGWQFPKDQDGDLGVVLLAPIPPSGMTAEEGMAEVKQSGGPSEEQREHWRIKTEVTGREVLTWREIAILGWTVERAVQHRGTASAATAKVELTRARRKLREEGWTVESGKRATHPEDKSGSFAREVAAVQRKSNWLSRLPASAR
jgi:hypothetical protein